jgi:Tol biopolymer transport system component
VGDPVEPVPDIDAVGPIAFSPDGTTVYFASPNDGGMVDLWAMSRADSRSRRLTSFSRDTYAPSVARDGTLVFKVQSYRTFVAEIAGGVPRQLTTFQAETPSWHPTLPLVAVTYGTWRRVVDDATYPDIAQEIGLVDAGALQPSTQPREVIARSESEDQAMTWSPNGKWIAFHSHREMSDDLWLRPADGRQPDRRLTFLGRGAEVGWPRWSPDGGTILLDGASPKTGRSSLFVVGVDQQSGRVTREMREVDTAGYHGEITHGEWLPDSRTVVAIAKEAAGRHAILSVPAGGGVTRVIHRFETEHDFPGLGVSADGRWIAFVAPAAEGVFQIFRIPASGGTPDQITRDPSHKTQPAYAPQGDRLAYTVWSYEAQFWMLHP